MISNDIELNVPADVMANWQEITDILAGIFQIPAALVMRFNDPYIEVLLSSKSEGNPYHPGDKEELFGSGLYCETVIKTQGRLHVPDALADVKWKSNPDVKLNMISYLGFPILLPDGKPFGTICVLDNKHNAFSQYIEKLMLQFRSMIQSQLELLYINQSLGEKNKRLRDYLEELQTLRGMISICLNCKSIKDAHGSWYPIEHYLIRHPHANFSHGICPECMKKHYPEFTKGC